MTIKLASQSGTLLRVKGDNINNYTRTAGVNWDSPTGQNSTRLPWAQILKNIVFIEF